MLFSDVKGWLDRYEREICGEKKRIRGRLFDGMKMEMHWDGSIVVILNPAIEGENLDSRTVSFVKNCMDPRELECFLTPARFEMIVKGEDEIKEEDWVWNDEQ